MDSEDVLDPRLAAAAALGAVATATVLHPRVRRLARRGLVLACAGLLRLKDAAQREVHDLVKESAPGTEPEREDQAQQVTEAATEAAAQAPQTFT